jgi:plastocyanin
VKRLVALLALLSLGVAAPFPAVAEAKHVPMKKLCKRKPSKLTKKQRKACKKWRARQRRSHHTAAPPKGPLTQPPVAPPVVTPPATNPGGSTNPAALGRLGVTAREFSLTVSRTQLNAGETIVQLQNRGEDPHNLRVRAADGGPLLAAFPDTDPGTVSDAHVTFAPGSYVLFCALPGHDSMRATITVQ